MRQCIGECPVNLDVPTIMRSYMYAYGYKNLSQAWHAIKSTEYSGECGNCTTCKVHCTAGFDIKEKIADISRIREIPFDFV